MTRRLSLTEMASGDIPDGARRFRPTAIDSDGVSELQVVLPTRVAISNIAQISISKYDQGSGWIVWRWWTGSQGVWIPLCIRR